MAVHQLIFDYNACCWKVYYKWDKKYLLYQNFMLLFALLLDRVWGFYSHIGNLITEVLDTQFLLFPSTKMWIQLGENHIKWLKVKLKRCNEYVIESENIGTVRRMRIHLMVENLINENETKNILYSWKIIIAHAHLREIPMEITKVSHFHSVSAGSTLTHSEWAWTVSIYPWSYDFDLITSFILIFLNNGVTSWYFPCSKSNEYPVGLFPYKLFSTLLSNVKNRW